MRTNKAATIDEDGTRRAQANIVATAYVIVTAKRRADVNIVATASKPAKRRVDGNTRRADTNVVAIVNKIATARVNVIATSAKAIANVARIVSANKAASNTKERVPTYWQPQIPT